MDTLPDELLDEIAFFAYPNDLGSLALTERRFYRPARKQTLWIAHGYRALLAFADCILATPDLAPLIRYVALEGVPLATPKSHWGISDMQNRAIIVVINECPRMESLSITRLPRAHACQKKLTSAVATLQHLDHVQLGDTSTINPQLSFSTYCLATPAFQNLSFLHVGLNFEDDLFRQGYPSALPIINSTEVVLAAIHLNEEGL